MQDILCIISFSVAEIFYRQFLSLLNDSYLSCLVNFCMFLAFEIIYVRTCTISPGGHKGDKDGYTIPAGTDVFISVSTNTFHTLFHSEEVLIKFAPEPTVSTKRGELYGKSPLFYDNFPV